MVGSSVAIQLNAQSRGLDEVVRRERQAFAAKVRIVRAVLGWSQTELGLRAGLTQRAIHKLEQGETEPRRTTVLALETIWREQHIEFEDLSDGGFQVSFRSPVFGRVAQAKSRRIQS
ncbi:MAG: helix-turn-helix transcriptional regulator [Pseudolabrys sp.]